MKPYLKEKLEVEQERRLKAEESAVQEKAEKVSLLEIVERHSKALPVPAEPQRRAGFWTRLFGAR